ncbi:MAG: SAM-dependent methyltransferase [Bacteroidetes bacterium]|nr:SAM-dependent methyltransferase [Bacteroidota bacterium]
MESEIFGKEFWSGRWKEGNTKWDIGYPSPPLQEYLDGVSNKDEKILIPGCGNAYEAEYLWKKGFTRVYLVDIAEKALEEFSKRVPDFPKDHLINKDFFDLEGINYWNLILEQTFFCALHPSLRKKYAVKMNELLTPAGRLVGVLFNDPLLTDDSPPFRGSEEEYRAIFSPYFTFTKMEPARNSIPPRAGRELFIDLRKKIQK